MARSRVRPPKIRYEDQTEENQNVCRLRNEVSVPQESNPPHPLNHHHSSECHVPPRTTISEKLASKHGIKMRSLQLIPLIVHLALSVPRLLPGAIVHQHGTTACVEDSIMVKLRISPTSLLEPISKLQNDLQEIQKNINRQVPNNTHQNYETSQILYHNVNSLQSKLNKIKYTIYHLPDPDNDTINTRRTKRGLFDFVGIISKSLFGTATDQDIHTVDTHIGKK
ncbi:uncharacterized protein LOC143025941 [Oratosquilla oratoria]|uniref:uncharacterized protein LOC143025941 n=1 Tax=Oratosquilla oratoria TaxID=337810 RepID=UPI003F763CEB